MSGAGPEGSPGESLEGSACGTPSWQNQDTSADGDPQEGRDLSDVSAWRVKQ